MGSREMFEAARSACERMGLLAGELDALEDGEWDGSSGGSAGAVASGVHSDPTATVAMRRSSAHERVSAEFDALAGQVEEADGVAAYVGSRLGWGYYEALELRYLRGIRLTWREVGENAGCSESAAKMRVARAHALVDSVGWHTIASKQLVKG